MTESLDGKSILIVEDEVVSGMMLVREIARAGGSSIGPVTSVCGALQAIEFRLVDMVILDAKLVDGWGVRLATCLEERRIPYVVVSGYDREFLPKELTAAPFVAKPMSLLLLMDAIETAMASR